MGRKNWAVICGNFRDFFSLKITLSRISDMLARGILEGAVLSTWKGEVDKIPDMRQALNDLGIYLVEQELITKEQAGSMYGYPLTIQKEQLRAQCH